jgi:hypothetical protein
VRRRLATLLSKAVAPLQGQFEQWSLYRWPGLCSFPLSHV